MDVVVVEVDRRDSIELGMEDIEENIEDIVDFSHKVLANLVFKTGFGVAMLLRRECVPIILIWM